MFALEAESSLWQPPSIAQTRKGSTALDRGIASTETVAGYVIDVGCVRENPRDELLDKARTHSQDCALMGHCIESGYGIVTENDRLVVLDAEATTKVVEAVGESDTEQGIRLRVRREQRDGSMATTDVEETT